jgi:ZIP family zinc transporter
VEVLVLLAAAGATTLATGLGALPVFFLGTRAGALQPAMLGFAAGVMAVASVAGLLVPGLEEGSVGAVGAGLAVGGLFLLGARFLLERRADHARRVMSKSSRLSLLVFIVLFVHSLPEGFAIGTAYASKTSGLALFVILAIGAQNIPEGTSVAIPMAAAGAGRVRQFWAAVATSAPQPIGALVAYVLVEEITGLLPFSFGFAAGAMLALIAVELAPRAIAGGWGRALAGALCGAALMGALSVALNV